MIRRIVRPRVLPSIFLAYRTYVYGIIQRIRSVRADTTLPEEPGELILPILVALVCCGDVVVLVIPASLRRLPRYNDRRFELSICPLRCSLGLFVAGGKLVHQVCVIRGTSNDHRPKRQRAKPYSAT